MGGNTGAARISIALEKDLSEGAQLAPGELTFDRQLKIVTARRSEAPATVTGKTVMTADGPTMMRGPLPVDPSDGD
jgi:hypothetical protein